MNGKEFLGRGLKFPLQVDRRTGEFGSNINYYTFAPSSSSNRQTITRQIREQLLYQEPRIEDVEVTCRQMDQQTGAIVVEISYTVRSTNNRYNHVYPFYLTEGSEGGGGA